MNSSEETPIEFPEEDIPPIDTPEESPVAIPLQVWQSNNQFTFDLYKILANEPENVVFSPISIHILLSMAFQGAQGTTANCFASALKIPEARTAADGYNSIINSLNDLQGVTLSMANKIYLNNSLSLAPDFENTVVTSFHSEVEKIDFGRKSAPNVINEWVEKKTNNKIKNLIKKDDLNGSTPMVMVNAIYFKGSWLRQFKPKHTRKGQFYINDKESVEVFMMNLKSSEFFNYKEDYQLKAQVLELPYINEKVRLVLILPKKRTGIAKLEKKLIDTDLSKITEGLENTDVFVSIPRFKIERTFDLKDCLTKLGLGEIFDASKANFGGMTSTPCDNFCVAKCIQKAVIDINEKGTEAGAATCMAKFMSMPPSFVADHPFMFMLVEQNVLFMGKVMKP